MNKSDTQKSDNSAGVSEIIGAVLLISLVVVSIGIVAALLFSQTSTPTKIPNMNFMTGVSADQHTLYLSHTGGDTLNLNEFSVLLDGQAPASPPTVSGGGSQWSLGTTLIVPISTVPQNVQIVYNSSGSAGAVLLRQASNVNTTVNLTADQLPYLDCSAVANPTCLANIPSDTINTMYMTNTTQKLIRFKASNQPRGTIPGGAGAAYHFNFTVSDDSTIVIGSTFSNTCAAALKTFYLKNGDTVGIVLTASPDSFYIYGIGSQIWYMNVGNYNRVTIQIINQTTTTTYAGTNALCSAYIKGYTNLDSTIDVSTATTNVITSLSVNNTQYINGVNASTITLQNVVPIDNGLFLVTFGAAGEPVYFVGWAASISGLTPPLGL